MGKRAPGGRSPATAVCAAPASDSGRRPPAQDPVWITDVAAVTALGDDIDTLWERLVDGRSAIRPVTRFPVGEWSPRVAACIPALGAQDRRSLFTALLERLVPSLGPVASDTVLITATTKAGIDCLERLLHDTAAEPADTLLSAPAAHLCALLGLTGAAFNISAACASGTIALARGALMVASGRAEAVLVCGLDLVSEFVFSGFAALGALSPGPCAPFDRKRCGLSLGEGAAAIMLMSAARARREGRACLGRIVGWGVAGDAAHITAPARDASGLVASIRQALFRACLTAEAVDAVSAHGTGTIYNDLMELNAVEQVFGDRPVAVHSVKGAIGHTLGAAGVIEAVLGVMSLLKATVPPTVGFRNPERGAAGRVSARPRALTGDVLLSTNSGFGGINAALLIQKGGDR